MWISEKALDSVPNTKREQAVIQVFLLSLGHPPFHLSFCKDTPSESSKKLQSWSFPGDIHNGGTQGNEGRSSRCLTTLGTCGRRQTLPSLRTQTHPHPPDFLKSFPPCPKLKTQNFIERWGGQWGTGRGSTRKAYAFQPSTDGGSMNTPCLAPSPSRDHDLSYGSKDSTGITSQLWRGWVARASGQTPPLCMPKHRQKHKCHSGQEGAWSYVHFFSRTALLQDRLPTLLSLIVSLKTTTLQLTPLSSLEITKGSFTRVSDSGPTSFPQIIPAPHPASTRNATFPRAP